jgi:hypothetical protein
MSVSGRCELCSEGEVEHTCDRCAALVCEDHFETEMGLCVECVTEVGPASERTPDPEQLPDGVDVYRF